MPNASELARIEAESHALDIAAIDARAIYDELPLATRKALRELIRQEDRDAYAAKLRAASARRRELND